MMIENISNDYIELGEDLVIWKNDTLKRTIKDFTGDELKIWIDRRKDNNSESNKIFLSILEDVLLKRRYKRIICTIKKLKH